MTCPRYPFQKVVAALINIQRGPSPQSQGFVSGFLGISSCKSFHAWSIGQLATGSGWNCQDNLLQNLATEVMNHPVDIMGFSGLS